MASTIRYEVNSGSFSLAAGSAICCRMHLDPFIGEQAGKFERGRERERERERVREGEEGRNRERYWRQQAGVNSERDEDTPSDEGGYHPR